MIHSRLERSVAGLQVGTFGGIVLLAVMMLVSTLDRRPWWGFPNLLAAQFYGTRVINSSFGWPAISGIAFQLLLAGTAGLLFGALFGGFAANRRISLLGVAWGVVLYYVSDVVFRNINPNAWFYIPRTTSLVAHLMYGTCLAAIGRIGEEAPAPARFPAGPMVATSPLEASVSGTAASNESPEVAGDASSNQNGSSRHPAPEQRHSRD